jgi:hypothetical protein
MGQINLSGSIGLPGFAAILGNYNVIFASDADHALTAVEWSNNFLEVTSSVSLTTTHQLIAPLNQGQEFVVQNNTTGDQSIEVIGATGTGITIANGATVSVVCDGTNYLAVGGGESGNATSIQGYPVLPTAPVTGQAIEWNGTDYLPLTLPIQSVLNLDGYDGYSIFVEVGTTITNPSFTATYSGNQVSIVPTAATIQDDIGNPPQNIVSTPDAFTYDGYTYQYNYYPSTPLSVTFTLTSSYYGAETTSLVTVSWVQNVYYGVGLPGYSTNSDIQSLANSFLSDSIESSFTVDAGSDDGYVIYYAYRSNYGTGDFWVNSFEGGFSLVSDMIRVTNSQGFVDYYSLYQSDQINLGVTEVSVFSSSPMLNSIPSGVELGLNQTLSWTALNTDGYTNIYTLSPSLASNEVINIAATINIAGTNGADGYSALFSRRFFGVQNIAGVLSDPIGNTLDIASIPPLLGTYMSSASARIAVSGTDIVIWARRPAGMTGLYAAATVDLVRGIPGLSPPMITSIVPSSAGEIVSSPLLLQIYLNRGGNGAVAAYVDGYSLTNVTVLADTLVVGTLPAGTYPSGSGNVVIISPASPAALNNGFTFESATPITNITPNFGSAAGGWALTITNTSGGYMGASNATIAGVACTSFVVVNDTTVTCVAPAFNTANGSTTGQTVSVITPLGASSSSSSSVNTKYYYLPSNTAFTFATRGDVNTASGGVVSAWTDLSGNGNSFVASGSQQPSLSSNFNGTGIDYLSFDGASNGMYTPSVSFTTGASLFMVSAFTNIGTGSPGHALSITDSGSPYTAFTLPFSGYPYFNGEFYGSENVSDTTADINPHVFTAIWAEGTPGTPQFWVDSSEFTGSVNTISISGPCSVGALWSGSSFSNYSPINVFMTLCYTGTLSSSDVTTVQSIMTTLSNGA